MLSAGQVYQKLFIFHFCSAIPKSLWNSPESHSSWISFVCPPALAVKRIHPGEIFLGPTGKRDSINVKLVFFPVVWQLILDMQKVIFMWPFLPLKIKHLFTDFLVMFSYASLTLLRCVIFFLLCKDLWLFKCMWVAIVPLPSVMLWFMFYASEGFITVGKHRMLCRKEIKEY